MSTTGPVPGHPRARAISVAGSATSFSVLLPWGELVAYQFLPARPELVDDVLDEPQAATVQRPATAGDHSRPLDRAGDSEDEGVTHTQGVERTRDNSPAQRSSQGPAGAAASVEVTQLPRGEARLSGSVRSMGLALLSSIPFVMLHDDGGVIEVVVKDEREGPDGAQFPLLSGFPRDAASGFGIGDIGDIGASPSPPRAGFGRRGGGRAGRVAAVPTSVRATLTGRSTRGGQAASAGASIPEAFNGASVGVQAGGYQQADSTGRGRRSDVGSWVTFQEFTITDS